jgi:hypothetical protein
MTAPDIPNAVSILLDTPRNGHIPMVCARTTLLINTADIIINKYSISFQF